MKQCTECKEEKSDGDFYATRRKCKECVKKRKRQDYNANHGQARAEAKGLYEGSKKAAIRRIEKFMKQFEQ